MNSVKVESNAFEKALRVLELVPVRPGIPSSEMIKVEGKKKEIVMSLASEVSGVVQVPILGEWLLTEPFFIDRKIISPFVFGSKVKEISFELNIDKGNSELSWVKIRIGRRYVSLTNGTLAAGYIPIPNENVSQIILPNKIKKLISVAKNFCPVDDVLPQLECVYVSEDGQVMSSNDMIIFYGTNPTEIGKTIYLPLASVGILENDMLKGIGLTKKTMILQFDNGKLIQPFPNRIQKDFPVQKLKDCALEHQPLVGRFSSAKLALLFKRFNRYLASVKDKTLSFTGIKDKGLVRVRAEAGNAVFNEVLRKDVEVLKDFVFKLPLDGVSSLITYAVEKGSDIKIRLGKDTPYRLETGDVVLVVARRIE